MISTWLGDRKVVICRPQPHRSQFGLQVAGHHVGPKRQMLEPPVPESQTADSECMEKGYGSIEYTYTSGE